MFLILFYHITREKPLQGLLQINPGNPFFLLFAMVAEFTVPDHGEAANLGQLDNKTEFQMGF